MARSSYIYAVLSGLGLPLATFTVKHELIAWMRKWPQDRLYELVVWRMHDGPGGKQYEYKNDELLRG